MARSAQRVIRLGWRDAEPIVIQLLAHSFVIGMAALCIAAVLLEAKFLLWLGEFLFGSMESYVKAAIIVGEMLFTIGMIRFAHKKTCPEL